MRARTTVRAMEAVGEATGLPRSGQRSAKVDDQEDWEETADETVIRPPTPGPKTPDTGKSGVAGYPQSL